MGDAQSHTNDGVFQSNGPNSNSIYNKISRLGLGYCGDAYIVRELANNNIVTARFIEISKLSLDKINVKDVVKLVESEIDCINRCSDINEMIHYVDYVTNGHDIAIIQQYFPCGTIENLVNEHRKGGLPRSLSHRIIIQLASGLYQIHKKGLGHGNIRVNNIFIENKSDMTIKIGEFCLTSNTSRLRSILSYTNRIDTGDYISPEEWTSYKSSFSSQNTQSNNNISQVDHKSDVYSFGITLIKLCFGTQKIIYSKFRKSMNHVYFRLLFSKYQKFFYVPNDLVDLILNCIHLNHDNRFSMEQVVKHPYFTNEANMTDDRNTYSYIDAAPLSGDKGRIQSYIVYGKVHRYTFSDLKLSSNFAFISKLKFRNCGLNNELSFIISNSLDHMKRLEVMDLNNNRIGGEGLEILTDHFNSLGRLTELYMLDNNIGDNGFCRFSECLKYVRGLKVIHLANCNVGEDGAYVFGQNMKYIRGLTKLLIGNGTIGIRGAIQISDNLKYVPRLEHLGLAFNSIKDEGIIHLSQHLKLIPRLKILNIGWNDLTEKGVEAFSQNMKFITNLERLCLHRNNIDSKLITNISQFFRFVPKLQQLDLQCNKIGDDGIQPLAQLIRYLPNLKTICLGENSSSRFRNEGWFTNCLDLITGK